MSKAEPLALSSCTHALMKISACFDLDDYIGTGQSVWRAFARHDCLNCNLPDFDKSQVLTFSQLIGARAIINKPSLWPTLLDSAKNCLQFSYSLILGLVSVSTGNFLRTFYDGRQSANDSQSFSSF